VDDALTTAGQNAYISPERKGSIIAAEADVDLDRELTANSGEPQYYPNGV